MSNSASVPGACPETLPCLGTIPNEGRNPYTPQKWEGMRIDPAVSPPTSNPVKPAATAAADPPDEPPGVFVTSHGLFVVPYTSLCVCQSRASAGKLDLPNTIAPASLSLDTASASLVETWCPHRDDPPVVRIPA